MQVERDPEWKMLRACQMLALSVGPLTKIQEQALEFAAAGLRPLLRRGVADLMAPILMVQSFSKPRSSQRAISSQLLLGHLKIKFGESPATGYEHFEVIADSSLEMLIKTDQQMVALAHENQPKTLKSNFKYGILSALRVQLHSPLGSAHKAEAEERILAVLEQCSEEDITIYGSNLLRNGIEHGGRPWQRLTSILQKIYPILPYAAVQIGNMPLIDVSETGQARDPEHPTRQGSQQCGRTIIFKSYEKYVADYLGPKNARNKEVKFVN
jgi:hypothetical protein